MLSAEEKTFSALFFFFFFFAYSCHEQKKGPEFWYLTFSKHKKMSVAAAGLTSAASGSSGSSRGGVKVLLGSVGHADDEKWNEYFPPRQNSFITNPLHCSWHADNRKKKILPFLQLSLIRVANLPDTDLHCSHFHRWCYRFSWIHVYCNDDTEYCQDPNLQTEVASTNTLVLYLSRFFRFAK